MQLSIDDTFERVNVFRTFGHSQGLNACPVNATDNKSSDFVIIRMPANSFETFSQDINECRTAFFQSAIGGQYHCDTQN